MHIIIGFVLLVLAFGLFPRVALILAGLGALGTLAVVVLLAWGSHIH